MTIRTYRDTEWHFCVEMSALKGNATDFQFAFYGSILGSTHIWMLLNFPLLSLLKYPSTSSWKKLLVNLLWRSASAGNREKFNTIHMHELLNRRELVENWWSHLLSFLISLPPASNSTGQSEERCHSLANNTSSFFWTTFMPGCKTKGKVEHDTADWHWTTPPPSAAAHRKYVKRHASNLLQCIHTIPPCVTPPPLLLYMAAALTLGSCEARAGGKLRFLMTQHDAESTHF